MILVPFFLTYSGKLPSAFSFYAMIGIIAVFFTIIPLFLNLYALTGINSSVVGMLLNINPIIAFTLAAWVFHEQINLMQVVSYSIILIAVIVFNGKEIFVRKEGNP